MAVAMTSFGHTSTAVQERLLEPPRLEHFCPAEHCSKRCGATTCTCAPCRSSCEFCRARRNTKPPVEFEIQTDFSHRQLSLIPDFRSINQRSKK